MFRKKSSGAKATMDSQEIDCTFEFFYFEFNHLTFLDFSFVSLMHSSIYRFFAPNRPPLYRVRSIA